MVNTLATFGKEVQPWWNVIRVELTEHLNLTGVEQYSSLGLWYLHHLCLLQLQDPTTKTCKVRPLKKFTGVEIVPQKSSGGGMVGSRKGCFSLQLKPASSIGTFWFPFKQNYNVGKAVKPLNKCSSYICQGKIEWTHSWNPNFATPACCK